MQGFILNNSICGGTGSGLGTLILAHIDVLYRKKTKFGMHIFPSSNLASCVVDPYNALFTMHWLLDHTQFSLQCVQY